MCPDLKVLTISGWSQSSIDMAKSAIVGLEVHNLQSPSQSLESLPSVFSSTSLDFDAENSDDLDLSKSVFESGEYDFKQLLTVNADDVDGEEAEDDQDVTGDEENNYEETKQEREQQQVRTRTERRDTNPLTHSNPSQFAPRSNLRPPPSTR